MAAADNLGMCVKKRLDEGDLVFGPGYSVGFLDKDSRLSIRVVIWTLPSDAIREQ